MSEVEHTEAAGHPASEAAEAIIRFEGIGKVFTRGASRVAALEDITLDVRRGEVFAVIGFSGAGKSTLVRLINALETPTSGTVTVDGDTATQESVMSLATGQASRREAA